MYELFVLGELLDQPLHGYVLHQVVEMAIGPIRQLSWGALYPLLQRLEREDLIAAEGAGGEGGGDRGRRERKRYRITAAGEARFRALMSEPGAYDTDYPDRFTLKLTNFHHVDRDGQLAILRHYRGYVQFIQDYLLTSRRHVTHEPAIPEAERPHILRALEHRLHLARADLQWLDAEVARIEGAGSESSRQHGP